MFEAREMNLPSPCTAREEHDFPLPEERDGEGWERSGNLRGGMSRLVRPQTTRARALRRASTPAETILWRLLRGRRLAGAKFRRQHPLGPYVVDFFCEEARLVVEADGRHHVGAPEHDIVRDRWFLAAGIIVLRFWNQQILDEPEAVLRRIRAALSLRERAT